MLKKLFFIAAIAALGACSAPTAKISAPPSPAKTYPLTGRPQATQEQCVAILKKHNPDLKIKTSHKELVKIYYEEAALENIRPDIAFAQALLETGYFKSEKARKQNNFCGLGATDDGAAGAKFRDVRTGVRAHVQHLKAYTSKEKPKTKIVDPRYEAVYKDKVKGGTSRTVNHLTGKWATDPQYHTKIITIYERILTH